MTMRRVSEQLKDQNWVTAGLALVIVILGVVIGLQLDRLISGSGSMATIEIERATNTSSVVMSNAAVSIGEEPMNDLDKLVAIEDIKKAKARYFRAVDTKEFDLLYSVFTEDATFDMRQAMRDPVTGKPDHIQDLPLIEGRPGIIELISGTDGVQTVHHGHNPEIEITSETTATGIWPMEDIAIVPGAGFRGYGHYRETYVKTDEGWRIKTLLLTRTLVAFNSVDE